MLIVNAVHLGLAGVGVPVAVDTVGEPLTSLSSY
jgi:hypothetical protein